MANILPLALVLIVIAAGGNAGMAGAQSPPPNSSSSSCTASLLSLAPCLAFLQGGPNNNTPTQGCCTALSSVVKTNAACLCQVLTTTNNPLGIPINQTQALALPGACKITTPPVSQCKSPAVSSPPAAAPSSPTPVVSSPTPSTANSPAISAGHPPSTTTPSVGAVSPSSPRPTAKSPAISAAPLPSTTTPSVGAVSPPGSGHEAGPTASTNAGSMMGVMSMFINVVGMMGVSISMYAM